MRRIGATGCTRRRECGTLRFVARIASAGTELRFRVTPAQQRARQAKCTKSSPSPSPRVRRYRPTSSTGGWACNATNDSRPKTGVVQIAFTGTVAKSSVRVELAANERFDQARENHPAASVTVSLFAAFRASNSLHHPCISTRKILPMTRRSSPFRLGLCSSGSDRIAASLYDSSNWRQRCFHFQAVDQVSHPAGIAGRYCRRRPDLFQECSVGATRTIECLGQWQGRLRAGCFGLREVIEIVTNLICDSQRFAVACQHFMHILAGLGESGAQPQRNFKRRRCLLPEDVEHFLHAHRSLSSGPTQLRALAQAKGTMTRRRDPDHLRDHARLSPRFRQAGGSPRPPADRRRSARWERRVRHGSSAGRSARRRRPQCRRESAMLCGSTRPPGRPCVNPRAKRSFGSS